MGDWTGVFWTPPDAVGGHSTWDVSGWMVGEEDYEGLTYYYRVSGPWQGRSVEGVIYSGGPPLVE